MNRKRMILIVAILFSFSLVWNAVVHLFILKDVNAAATAIRRPDMGDYLWLSLMATLGISALFTVNYSKWRKTGTVREALLHSLFFGLLAGILVDLNQFVLYPLPVTTVTSWFGFGMIEFVCYGLVAWKLWMKTI